MSNEHFNLIARFYDEAAQFRLEESLLRELDLPCDCLLLDAGGGTGRVAAALRQHLGGAVVTDVSPGMLKYARGKGLDCVRAPVENLPFASGTFDRVFMLDAFHHVRSQTETARDLFRVLRPGGRLLIIEPDIRKFAVKLIALGEKLLLMRSHFLSGREIAVMFSALGAEVGVMYHDVNVWVHVEKKC